MCSQENQMKKPFGRLLLLTITWTFVFSGLAGAQPTYRLAKDLVRLRSDVEQLSSKLELKKEDLRTRLRLLAQQKAELEMELQRETLKLKQLEQEKAKQQQRVAAVQKSGKEHKPAVIQGSELIKSTIQTNLPFRTEDRQADLERLVDQLNGGLLSAEAAVGRLWSFIEDELRMGRESGIYQQVVTLGGKRVYADVLRIGMVMLFFKTRDDVIGRAVRRKSGWAFVPYDGTDEHDRRSRKLVLELFDSFKKQIRSGFFELPNALAKGGQS